MKTINIHDRLDIPSQAGLWVEEENNHWRFFIQDKEWMPEELKAIQHRPSQIHFLIKKGIPLFLIQIEDVLECSDIPVFLPEWKYDVTLPFYYEFIFVNQEKEVVAKRFGSLNSSFNQALDQTMTLEEAAFEQGYDQLIQEGEPYEWEKEALAVEIMVKGGWTCWL